MTNTVTDDDVDYILSLAEERNAEEHNRLLERGNVAAAVRLKLRDPHRYKYMMGKLGRWQPRPYLEQLVDGAVGRIEAKGHIKPRDGGPGHVNAGLTLIRGTEVESKPIRWLWPHRIAKGKVNGIAGVPDMGKSQVTMSITGIVTTGGAWPDGGRAEVGHVLIMSAEDDFRDTIRPRLEAAGADLNKVTYMEMTIAADDGGRRMFSFKSDLERLRKVLKDNPDISLLVVDPVAAYMGAGETDTFKNSDVRGVLAPLGELAEKADVAVLFVTHFRKDGSGSALNRVTDSIAFTALARCFWAVLPEIEDGNETGRKLFVRIKNNIAKPIAGLAYKIAGTTLESGIETSCIEWDEEVEMTADQVIQQQQHQGTATAKADKAVLFLYGALADGPVESTALVERARQSDISERTLKRAKKEAGVHSYRQNERWFWELTDGPDGPWNSWGY